MALWPRLDLRQSQTLAMTPQLQQAIKLLALSNLEIEAFLGEALETNPLLEAGEITVEAASGSDLAETPREDPSADELILRGEGEADAPLDIDPTALDRDRDTGDWSATASAGGGEDGPDIGERGNDEPTLAEHLEAQVGTATNDPRVLFVARHLIGLLDEAGYLATPLREVAADLDVPLALTGCRDVAELDAFDRPAEMEVLVRPLWAPPKVASALAMITAEWVGNALEHGLGERSGRVEVRLEPTGSGARLVVADSGRGNADGEWIPGFGLALVASLAKQVGGRVHRIVGPRGARLELELGRASLDDAGREPSMLR